ncbi:hypothetical protein ABFV54_27385, partial [Pseudomonas syringae]|uniref:hypothetical protein n=1 Tax=Pseudomonas syringae TaxID=317 RepID=UPI0034D6A745
YNKKVVVNRAVELGFFHDVEDMLVDNNHGYDVTDSDRFYFYSVSFTQSFSAGHASNNILGRALCSGGFVWLAGDNELQFYQCERVKEA